MFLYVRLFLRKKSQWFRVNKLGYYSDISDISTASTHLCTPSVSLAEPHTSLLDIDQALSLLSLDELKDFAKESKCLGTTKAQISASLAHMARTQTGLKKCSNGQLTLNFTPKGVIAPRTDHYVQKILDRTGPLIRLLAAPVTLFHRLHTVFFRSTNYDEKSLATLILAKISRRNFPEYVVQRTSNVFHSREQLLEYERAIVYKKEVDDILEGMSGVPTQQGLERVKEVFEEVYPLWKAILKVARGKPQDIHEDNWESMYYLQRYSPGRVSLLIHLMVGWVYTRLVFKGAYVLSRFHDYEREWEVLAELLDQKLFRRGRRGEWWERRALIEVPHHPTRLTPGTLHVAIRKDPISISGQEEMA
jgi:fanconi-associated nuclease 1